MGSYLSTEMQSVNSPAPADWAVVLVKSDDYYTNMYFNNINNKNDNLYIYIYIYPHIYTMCVSVFLYIYIYIYIVSAYIYIYIYIYMNTYLKKVYHNLIKDD